MSKVIITTVGTSLLTNLIKKEVEQCFGFDLENEKELISKGILEKKTTTLDTYCKKFIFGSVDCLEFQPDDFYKTNFNASAEIKSICKIANREPAIIYFLCTDTFMSEYAAKKIKEYLSKNEVNELSFPKNSIIRIADLKIDEPTSFEESGFENLLHEIDEIHQREIGKTEQGKKFILNISGGYKAITPFLTIYAQVKKIPINYIYEKSEKLISIERTPLEFDWELIEQNYLAFEKFDDKGASTPLKEVFLNHLSGKEKEARSIFQELQDNGIIQIKSEKINLTLLGKLYWKEYFINYNGTKFNRKSLHSKLIEYMVYEYYVKLGEYQKVKLGHKPEGSDYDIDVYLEDKETIYLIEVKPGGNIPVNIKGKKDDKNTVEYKLKEGSFKYVAENESNGKNIVFMYVCYKHIEIHPSPIRQMKDVLNNLNEKYIGDFPQNINFQLCWLKVPSNYKADTNWKIDTNNKIEILFTQDLKNTNNHV